MTYSLADFTWPEAERRASVSVLAVPVGATEQHGPHLPLSTDTDIAVALAEALGRNRSGTVVAPAIAYGSSGEHSDFSGTLSIGQHAIEFLLLELGRSAFLSFSRVLFVSGHGGNIMPLRRAERRLRSEGHDVRAYFPRWRGDAHAGRVETSLMLALDPARVRLDRLAAGARPALCDLLPDIMIDGVRKVSDNGVLGDPTGASAEEGRRLLESAVDALIHLLDGWEAPAA